MEGGVEEVSIEELASNLSTYNEQLEQVRTNCLLFVLGFSIWFQFIGLIESWMLEN